MGPTGSKFCPIINQQTLRKGELENNSIQILFMVYPHLQKYPELNKMYPIFNNQYIAPYIFTHVFSTFFISVPP